MNHLLQAQLRLIVAERRCMALLDAPLAYSSEAEAVLDAIREAAAHLAHPSVTEKEEGSHA